MYIDSNIFIYSAIDNTKIGENCRKILKKIENDKITAASSLLTIDETLWILQKQIGRKEALKNTKIIQSLPIKWINLKKETLYQTFKIYNETQLDPRDAIHLASMKQTGHTTLLSEDQDFDDIEEIDRIATKEYLNTS
ncbi:MAG: type II toxin-antitoxin system VapC family toxin, partial [Candidatus Thermoplasmatota archaeon]